MDVVVYSLLGDVYTFLAKHSGNLSRRPIVLYYHLVYAPPQFLRLAVVPFKSMFAPHTFALGIAPHILPIGIAVASYFAQYRRWMNFYRSCNFSY